VIVIFRIGIEKEACNKYGDVHAVPVIIKLMQCLVVVVVVVVMVP
jgi:hypothetical protein